MNIFLRTTIFACFVILCASNAMAQTLNVITLALAPYGFTQNHKETGLAYEIGSLLAQEAGYTPNNTIAPLSRSVNDLSTGSAEITIMLPTPEVERIATQIGPVLSVESVVIGRAGTPMRNFSQIRGMTLAAVRGAKYDDRLNKSNGIITYPVESYEQGLKMLMAKRVDGMIGPKLGLFHTAQKMGLPKRSFGTPLILSSTDAVLFISNMTVTPEKIRRLQDALKRLQQNDRIKSLIEKYSL